jgi:hypothetical protein
MPRSPTNGAARIVATCFIAGMAWGLIIYIHIFNISTDMLTSISDAMFYDAIFAGASFGLILAITGAVAAWFRPWPMGRNIGVCLATGLGIAAFSMPGYALIAPSVASRLTEWRIFGWSAFRGTSTLHRVYRFDRDDKTGAKTADIDPYGEWVSVAVNDGDYQTLVATGRPGRPSDYCVSVNEERSAGIARIAHERGPIAGPSKLSLCPKELSS